MPQKVYKILKNDVFGRYMVASKNIKQGQLILKENPILIGPQLNGSMVCFNCCTDLRRIGYIFCVNCKKAVICNPKCTGKFHNELECKELKYSNLLSDDIVNNEQIVFPMRCLLLKKYSEEKWSEIVKLEHHSNFRRDSPIWRRHKIVVEDVLKSINFLSDDEIDNEVVQKICGVLDVNTFEVRPSQNNALSGISNPDVECLRGLYLDAAMMTHDCLSNTHLSVDNNFTMTVHASVDIAENEIVYFNYANVLQGSCDRKQHLREGKYFECQCNRCKDPSELGTELSSLKCYKCIKGLIRPIKPHEVKTRWECARCKTFFAEGLIRITVNEGKRLVQEIDTCNISKMEDLLKKLQRTFHAQHYLVLDLIQNLIGLYARNMPNKKNLRRKVELCHQLLSVLEKIEPGLSRLKAITLYELQSTEVDLAHKEYRSKEISIEHLIYRLIEAEAILKTAAKYLLYEPQQSPEGLIAQNALSELKLLRQSIISIQRDSIGLPQQVKPQVVLKSENRKVAGNAIENNNKENKEEKKCANNVGEGTKKRRNRRKNK